MNDKESRMLDALSRLNSEVVDKQTQRRVKLLNTTHRKRRNKRLFITIGSMAASLALIATTVVLLATLLTKQVPIYTGMSVSGENDTLTLSHTNAPLQYADPGKDNGNHYGHYNGDHANREEVSDEMLEAPLEDHLSVTGGAQAFYTAKPGETVLITVHFDNPDDFEILSFTLNGKKYASHMFRDGSDMENIIVEVNVGDAEGVVEYTIDAIKYVDGTKIKDVLIDGDRTIQIGVAANTQPSTAVSSEEISFDSVFFELDNEDDLNLIALSNGTLTAILYDGNTILFEKELSATETVSVSFEGLAPNRVYQYAVIAHYDAFDGNGMADHVLVQKTFRTLSPVLFDNVAVGVSTLSFSYLWDAGASERAVSASVWANGTKVRDVQDSTSVEGLLPATTYTLIAEYALNGKTEQITLEFTTEQMFYTVRYLLSPLTGTEYALESEQSVALMPGDIFAPVVKEIEGFTAPTAQTLTVSTEDGVRVIEYRYTRNSYNVSFNVNGTTTVRSLPYGSALADAEHSSHTFVGWQDASGNRYTTVPAKNVALYAVFEGELTADDLLFSGSGEITITGLRNTAFTNLVIPAYINGGKVVAIGGSAFKNATYLTSVTLPATLTRVGVDAFGGCTELERVTFDGTLAEWCNIAFAEDMNVLAATVNGHTFYPAARFASNPIVHAGSLYLTADPDVNVLAGALTLPTGTLSGTNCFAGAPTTTLVIPEGVSTIPDMLLTGLYDLATLRFNATNMPDMAETAPYRLLGAGVNGDGVAIEIGATVTRIPANKPFSGMKIKSITFAADSVCTAIGACAFGTGCLDGVSMNYITELHLPDGLLTIGERAFEGCTALASLSLPLSKFELLILFGETTPAVTSVTLLGNGALPAGAFEGWTTLTSVTLPEGITAIGENAFKDCTALTDITISGTMARIGVDAFSGCSQLKTVRISDLAAWCGITFETASETSFPTSSPFYAGRGDLYLGDTMITDLTIPTGVTSIAAHTFYGCRSIISASIPEGVTYIGSRAFAACVNLTSIALPNTLEELAYCSIATTGITSISLPASLRVIGDAALCENFKLTSITVPEGVTSIGDRAFKACAIESATLPSTLQTLGSSAFEGCTALTTIEISAGVTSIGASAFYGCEKLTAIMLPDTLLNVGNYAFQKCTQLSNVTFGQALTSIGTSAFNQTALTTASLPNTLTSIGGNAFEGCTGLTSVTFAEGCVLASIGSSAFKGCAGLTGISLPSGITTIGANAFEGCTGLTVMEIPASVTSIGDGAFKSCTNITTLTLPNASQALSALFGATPTHVKTVTVLGGESVASSAFLNCTGLVSVSLPNTVTSIGSSAFRGCTALVMDTLPSGLTTIGASAFKSCTGLTVDTLPSGLLTVGTYAFSGCTDLTVDTLPSGLLTVGTYAFSGCTGITSLSIPASVTSIGAHALDGCPLVSLALPACTGAAKLFSVGYEDESMNTVPETLARVTVVGTAIPARAFDGSPWLDRMELIIAEGVTSIGDHAFYQCSINSITFPSTLESIGEYAFYNCGAKTMTFLGGDIAMGEYAFSSCYRLKSVHINDVFAWATNSYADAYSSPLSSEAKPYLNGEPITEITIPADVRRFGPYAFYGFTSLASVHITDMTAWLDLEFEGLYANPMYYADHLYLNGQEITELTIPSGTTAIRDYAFYNVKSLQSITIPEGVTHIGANAFKGCTCLGNISLPNTLEYVGHDAFDQTVNTYTDPETGATYLGNEQNKYLVLMSVYGDSIDFPATTFVMPDQTKILYSAERAFDYSSFVCGSGLVCIVDCAFGYSHSAPPFTTFPDTLKYIGSYMYEHCSDLGTIVIPDSVVGLGRETFHATSIEVLKIGRGIETLKLSTFVETSVDELYLTNALKAIKCDLAYESDFYADTIYFDGTKEEWLAIEGSDFFSIKQVIFLQT